MIKEEVTQKYLDQANALEAEFFDIVDERKPEQHRVLKNGKSLEEFNQRHGEIWRACEAELIAEGFMEAPVKPELVRDLSAELDELKGRMVKMEEKGKIKKE